MVAGGPIREAVFGTRNRCLRKWTLRHFITAWTKSQHDGPGDQCHASGRICLSVDGTPMAPSLLCRACFTFTVHPDVPIHVLVTSCHRLMHSHVLAQTYFTCCHLPAAWLPIGCTCHAVGNLLMLCFVCRSTSEMCVSCCRESADAMFCVQEYIRETGACLIQLGQTQDKAAQARMEKLAVEASRLLGCVKLLNHDVHKAMLDGKLDPSSANTHRLGTAFYTNLTVSSPTNNFGDMLVVSSCCD